MQALELRNLTDGIAHAVSRDAERYNITRMLLAPDPEDAARMLAVATDGHRLAVATSSVGLGLDFGLLAAPAELKALPKARNKGGWSQLSVTNGEPGRYQIRTEMGGLVGCYRDGGSVTEGTHTTCWEFPNWRQIMPKDRKPSGLLHLNDGALDALAGMSHASPYVRLSLAGKQLLAEATSQGRPVYSARLELAEYDGAPFEPMGFTASYLVDALGFAANARGYVMVQFQDPMKPALFGDAHDFEIVMPARLG